MAVSTRRAVLGAATAATAATAVAAVADPAQAADAAPYSARKGAHQAKTVLLSDADRHLVSRFSYGVSQELAKDVLRQGGAQRWFQRQLNPNAIKDKDTDQLDHWWPSLHRSSADLWQRQIGGIEGGYQVMNDYARWVLMRRLTSNRQLLEVMSEFWENHLHVAAVGDPQFTHRVDYGKTIRKHALGRFDQMLVACAVHPAMLIFLDAYDSTKDHPNENLGRELLELHTVGVGNYTEKDVRDSARILTGWSVDAWKTWVPEYNEPDHYVGKVKVHGFRSTNTDPDGKAVTGQYLRYLAQHPDTAQRIAKLLVLKFVSDKNDPGLVSHLAKVYLENDTAIIPVLQALVASPAFAASGHAHGQAKVRDPGEDVVATYRSLGATIHQPTSEDDDSAVEALIWQTGDIGLVPFSWAQPNGQPIDSDSWSSPGRLLASMGFHSSASGGWPKVGVTWKEPKDWLPARHVQFDDLVDHLSRILLHEGATKRLVKACCTATGLKHYEQIDKDSDLVRWGFPRLLTTLLDSPTHLSR